MNIILYEHPVDVSLYRSPGDTQRCGDLRVCESSLPQPAGSLRLCLHCARRPTFVDSTLLGSLDAGSLALAASLLLHLGNGE